MSGKRHHYIPQLLLRGFSSRRNKKEIYSYVHETGKEPYEANIKNIAVETYFYKHGDLDADHSITKNEDSFATVINKIRSTETLDNVCLETIVAFVDSLVVRTKNMRTLLEASAGHLVKSMASEILADSYVKSMISTTLRNKKAIIEELVSDIARVAPHLKKHYIKRLVIEKFNQNKNKIESDLSYIIKTLCPHPFSSFMKKIPSEVAKSQIKHLDTEHHQGNRIQQYMSLKWSIERLTENALILGDIGPLGINLNGDAAPPILENNLHTILLPISSKLLLIGKRNQEPPPHPETVNKLSASMSIHFFISSVSSQEINKHIETLGTKATQYYKNTTYTALDKNRRTSQYRKKQTSKPS